MTENPGFRLVRGGFQPPWATLAMSIVCLTIYGIGGPAFDPLLLTGNGLGNGEIWRAITGHLVHCDREHLIWNVVALLLLGTLYESTVRPGVRRFVVELAGCGLAVSVAVIAFAPQLEAYCGLSGVLNGLYVLALGGVWRVTRSPLVLVSGFGDLGKIAIESGIGEALFTATAWPPVPVAHLAGFAAGCLILVLGSTSSFRFSVLRP